MRNIFITVLSFISFSTWCFCQNSYELIILEEMYNPLEKATLIDSNSYDYEDGWDDPEFSVPLGFTFSFLGNEIESLDQIGLGSLMFGMASSQAPLFCGLMPVGFDLADRGIAGEAPSLIRYQTTGNPGDRVFAIEWFNAGLYEEIFESDTVPVSSLNFQIWLYENDYSIEYRFGSMMYPAFDPVFDSQIITSIFLDYNFSSNQGNILTLSGHPAFCFLENINSSEDLGLYSLSYYVNAMVYRFEPTSTPFNVDDNNLVSYSIYPNPSSNKLTIEFGNLKGVETKIQLYDSSSKLVFETQSNSTIMIDVSGFSKGLYSLELSTDEQIVKRNIIVN